MKSLTNIIKKKSPWIVPFLMCIRNGTFKTMDKWPLEKLIEANQRHYKHRMGYSFDIRKPVLFTEKIQWYKFFYERNDFAQIVDKVLFKQYIEDKLGSGYTIPMYGAYKDVQSLEKAWYEILPNSFVLKANLQSDGKNIKIIRNKNNIDFKLIKKELESWLKIENTLMNSCDRRFYTSTPMILAEEYVSNFENQLYDYKFFCFDGQPFCMYVQTQQLDSPIMFYDLHWNKIDVMYGNHPNNVQVPKPTHFEEMMTIAQKLSSGFPFIRVDFFDTKEKLYMAELTFNPGGGFTPYKPVSFNKKMGDMFKLPMV